MTIPIIFVAVAGYYIYTKFVAEKLDCPANNQAVKGLEKEEIKAAIGEGEAKQKEVKEEIKQLEKDRKEILAGSSTDKGDKAKEKLEQKSEKIKELEQVEKDLSDLKVADKGGFKAQLPNKLSWNNALWIGGLLIALLLIYKICVAVFKSIFRSVGLEEQ